MSGPAVGNAPVHAMSAVLRVLVIEDDQRYRAMLVTMLRELGCAPAPVASALEALEWLARGSADVILLDLNLPRMDGLDFLERYRRGDERTPAIILTGVGTMRAAQAAIRLGVSDFLTKPCHLGTIEAALQRVRRQIAAAPPSPVVSAEQTATAQASDAGAGGAGAGRGLAAIERQAILDALQRHRGNRSAAAADLGISRRTLHYRLAQYRDEGVLPCFPDGRRSDESAG